MWLVLITIAEIPPVVRILSYYLTQTCHVFTQKRQVFVVLDLNGRPPLLRFARGGNESFPMRTDYFNLVCSAIQYRDWYLSLVSCLDVPTLRA